jgi:hypothetical protein
MGNKASLTSQSVAIGFDGDIICALDKRGRTLYQIQANNLDVLTHKACQLTDSVFFFTVGEHSKRQFYLLDLETKTWRLLPIEIENMRGVHSLSRLNNTTVLIHTFDAINVVDVHTQRVVDSFPQTYDKTASILVPLSVNTFATYEKWSTIKYYDMRTKTSKKFLFTGLNSYLGNYFNSKEVYCIAVASTKLYIQGGHGCVFDLKTGKWITLPHEINNYDQRPPQVLGKYIVVKRDTSNVVLYDIENNYHDVRIQNYYKRSVRLLGSMKKNVFYYFDDSTLIVYNMRTQKKKIKKVGLHFKHHEVSAIALRDGIYYKDKKGQYGTDRAFIYDYSSFHQVPLFLYIYPILQIKDMKEYPNSIFTTFKILKFTDIIIK